MSAFAFGVALGAGDAAASWPGILAGAAVALAVHIGFGVGTARIELPKKQERIEMAIVETKPPPPPPPKEEPPPPPKAEPQPKPKVVPPKPKKPEPKPPEPPPPPPPSNDAPPEEPPKEPVPIVTGISMSSTVKTGAKVAMRVGNTTYGDPNEEEFVPPDQVKAYVGGQKGWQPAKAASISREASVARRFRPKYPRQLVEEGIEGEVVVLVDVTKHGKTRSARVVKGLHPMLDKLTIQALQYFKWRPAEIDGVKVDSTIRHSFRWEISE